ncbi:MAG: carbohydrate ABC transporter permease, partial [Acidimicrobiales bacterium]
MAITTDSAAKVAARRHRRGARPGESMTRRWILYAVMIALAAFFLFPLVYMLASSLKPDTQVLANSQSPEAFLPTPFAGMEN